MGCNCKNKGSNVSSKASVVRKTAPSNNGTRRNGRIVRREIK